MKKYQKIIFYSIAIILVFGLIYSYSSASNVNWIDSGSDSYIMGNVGIGTSTPAYPLEVNGVVSVTGNVNPSTAGVYDLGTSLLTWDTIHTESIRGSGGVYILGYSGLYATLEDHNTVGDGIKLVHRGTPVLQVGYGANNNVGIGTSTPAYDLDVSGDINFTGTLYQNGSLVQTTTSVISPTLEWFLIFMGCFHLFITLINFIRRFSLDLK